MNISLSRYSIVDGEMVPDESGGWCRVEEAVGIMADAANVVYSQISAATEYANATQVSASSAKKYVDSVKTYLETVWINQ